MGSGIDGKNKDIVSIDMSLRALAFELKNPLISIARRAELGEPAVLEGIQQTAEQSLMLIDSYLLNAQTEYGQIMLDLEPVNIGAVLYDAAHRLHPQAKLFDTELVIDDRTSEPVMTHKHALVSALAAFGSAILGSTGETEQYKEITLRGFKTRDRKLGIGLFSQNSLTRDDIRRAKLLQGRAHMPMSGFHDNAHVSLAIAEGLCRAIGGEMKVKRMGKLSGLSTVLLPSEQLSLV